MSDLQRHCDASASDIRKASDALHRIGESTILSASPEEPSVFSVPVEAAPARYEAWIPIHGHTYAELDEPYLLYKGDSPADAIQSEDLFNSMCEDYERHTGIELLPLSDGDLDAEGVIRKKKHSARIYAMNRDEYSLKNMRLRAAQRHAIVSVTETYGDDEVVYKMLSIALNINKWQRVKAFRNVALKRVSQEKIRQARAEKIKSQTDKIYDAITNPYPTNETPLTKAACGTPEFASFTRYPTSLQYFCKHCSMFLCGLHDGKVVTPRKPIPDPNRDERIARLEEGRVSPCSNQCFMLPKKSQAPLGENERATWSPEETCLLREATLVFHRDPCRLSVVVGSKSCRQVYIQIKNDEPWISFALSASQDDRKVSMQEIFEVAPINQPRRKRAQKSTASRKFGGESNFTACDHPGPCTEEVCPCVRRHKYCETRCGCHHDRYVSKNGKIVSDEKLATCGQTQSNCDCVGGTCSTSSCSCRENGVACVPGVCGCDATKLPSEVHMRERKCRNSDFIVGRHKRTLVGKSNIDGFGLFAGCDFEKGEVVGLYDGVLWSSNLVEAATAVGEALKRTFAFNITKDHDIDATLMGSKVRFANHGRTDDRRNCEAKEVFIRGEICMALITIRAVKTGEEFLFDYQLTAGEDWFKEMK